MNAVKGLHSRTWQLAQMGLMGLMGSVKPTLAMPLLGRDSEVQDTLSMGTGASGPDLSMRHGETSWGTTRHDNVGPRTAEHPLNYTPGQGSTGAAVQWPGPLGVARAPGQLALPNHAVGMLLHTGLARGDGVAQGEGMAPHA